MRPFHMECEAIVSGTNMCCKSPGNWMPGGKLWPENSAIGIKSYAVGN